MIAYWPKGIKSKGGFTDHLGHVMDFMPTFLEIAKAGYPKTYNGHNITPYTGISLLPAFEGREKKVHDALYNEHFGARYIRDGEWKLVSLSSDTTWRLYKINQDETELNDLSVQYPDVVSRLSDQWQQWANTHQVLPKPGKK
jgi:arylsulfatase